MIIKNEEINLQKIEEELQLQGNLISETESFWSVLITKTVSKYQGLINKLQNTFDDALLPEIERLERGIKHLQDKATWEKKNIEVFQQKCKEFQKLQENQQKLQQKLLMTNLSAKLAKKLNRR